MITNKNLIIFFISCVIAHASNPFIDPFSNNKYGTSGSYSFFIDTVNFIFDEHVLESYCFLPTGKQEPYPVIFFCHGLNETDYNSYSGLINHILSKGYGLVYTPYRSFPINNRQQDSYETLYLGFKTSVAAHSSKFDTTNIGFVSHSFGAGAVPYVSNKLLTKDNWGTKSSFIYLMSPWYPCLISGFELNKYSKSTNMLIQVFDDDRVNDPRIARAIYNLIGIPVSNKKCMTLYGDSIPGFIFQADHDFPCRTPQQITIYHKNALFRTFDLLSSLTFNNDSIARKLLFTKASDTSVVLAYWKFGHAFRAAKLSDNVQVNFPQISYVNFWDHLINPLNEFNINFDYPTPLFYRTRITMKNYWKSVSNVYKPDKINNDSSFFKPESSFGSDGRWFAKSSEILNPRVWTHAIKIFEPKGIDTLVPVIFFSHSYLSSNVKNHQGLINHLVSKGAIVIYVNSMALEIGPLFQRRYDILINGFQEAADLLKSKIDTTRVGFVGQGFSAGAIPAIAYNILTGKNWGSNGSFLFLSSPWHMYFMDSTKLNSFPDNCRMIIQVYENERNDDWKIAADIYDKLQIPCDNKSFTILFSDKNGRKRLKANDKTFCSRIETNGSKRIDALDYYGIYKLIDALSAAAFYNDSSGKYVALGLNNPQQKYMGKWHNGTLIQELLVTDKPQKIIIKKHKQISDKVLIGD